MEKDQDATLRQTTTQWLEPHIPGAKLIGPKRHAVKVNWAKVPLAMDINSRKVSKSAMELFGVERGESVHDEMAGKTKAQGLARVGGS